MRSEPKGGQTRQNGSQSTLDRCKCSRCSRQTAGGQKIARQRSLAQAWRRVGQGYVAGHAARNPTEPLGALNGCRLMPKLDRAFLSKTKVTFVAAVFLLFSSFFFLFFFLSKKKVGDLRTLQRNLPALELLLFSGQAGLTRGSMFA